MAATYSEGQFSAAFFAASFFDFLVTFRDLLSSLPLNHLDAEHQEMLRLNANLLEAWYHSHRDRL